MDEQILIYAAILVAVIVLTIVGILSRYRKCKSDEVLVVYGKTGDKKSAKTVSRRSRFCMAHHSGILFPEHETHAD